MIKDMPSDVSNPVEWMQQRLRSPEDDKNPSDSLKEKEDIQRLQELTKQKQIWAEQVNTILQDRKDTTNLELRALMHDMGMVNTDNVNTLDETKRLLLKIATGQDEQEALMDSLRCSLGGKHTEKDHSKEMLKQLLTASNKLTGTGGTSTLKPEVLRGFTTDTEDFNAADWLTRHNRTEQGELLKLEGESTNTKNPKMKSGMLDRATSNIQQKQVWPQKNLMEDWADEDVEYKSLSFEQFIVGEICTIRDGHGPIGGTRQTQTAQAHSLHKDERI